jgi:hypothetical protein
MVSFLVLEEIQENNEMGILSQIVHIFQYRFAFTNDQFPLWYRWFCLHMSSMKAGSVTEGVELLLSKYKALNSNPSIAKQQKVNSKV